MTEKKKPAPKARKRPGPKPKPKPKNEIAPTSKIVGVMPRPADAPVKRQPGHESILAMSQRIIADRFGAELAAEYGAETAAHWHPAVLLCVASADPNLTFEQRAGAAKAVMPYMLPTLKSVEVSGNKENPLVVEVRDARRHVFEKLGMASYLNADGDIVDAELLEAE